MGLVEWPMVNTAGECAAGEPESLCRFFLVRPEGRLRAEVFFMMADFAMRSVSGWVALAKVGFQIGLQRHGVVVLGIARTAQQNYASVAGGFSQGPPG